MRFLKPSNFELYEWLPRGFYQKHYPVLGENLWHLIFSYEIRYTADRLRKRFGPMQMNTWFWAGDGGHQYRGYRPLDSPIGAKASQHKAGNALDGVFKHRTSDEVRSEILADPDHEDFKYINCIEMGTSWVHVDCRELIGTSRIFKIYP